MGVTSASFLLDIRIFCASQIRNESNGNNGNGFLSYNAHRAFDEGGHTAVGIGLLVGLVPDFQIDSAAVGGNFEVELVVVATLNFARGFAVGLKVSA